MSSGAGWCVNPFSHPSCAGIPFRRTDRLGASSTQSIRNGFLQEVCEKGFSHKQVLRTVWKVGKLEIPISIPGNNMKTRNLKDQKSRFQYKLLRFANLFRILDFDIRICGPAAIR